MSQIVRTTSLLPPGLSLESARFESATASMSVSVGLVWLADDWIYCPGCGSCGIGGCCPRYCPICRDRHDEADEREDAQGIGEGAL